MGVFSTIGTWRRKLFIYFTLPLLTILALYFGLQSLGPSWKAKHGEGVTGTFTATHEECGRRSCTMHGIFTPTGTAGAVRDDVTLRDSGDSMRIGDTRPALDSGDSATVFPPGGGSGLGMSIAMISVGTIVLAGYGFVLVRKVRRRRTAQMAPVTHGPGALAQPGRAVVEPSKGSFG